MTYIYDMTAGCLLEQYEIDALPEVTLFESPVEISAPQPRLETISIGLSGEEERMAPFFLAGRIDDLVN